MSETIEKEIENVDELFKEIVINGQTFASEKDIKPKIKRETPSQQPSPEPEPLPVPSEPVEVTKTVENVDEQFFEIVLNGNTIQSDKAVTPETKISRAPKQEDEQEEITVEPPSKGQNVKTVNLNNVLHDFEDPNAYSEIQQIQTEINQLQSRLDTLLALIPSQASASNQLADKAFVNSSVQTATANFRGNWNDFSSVPTDVSLYPVDYAGSKTPTVNDYLVVRDASDYTEDTLEGTWRFKYSGTWSVEGKNGWRPEYQVNETPLTQAQLEALNSGITAQAVQNMAVIDDTTPSSTKVYSSQKTQSELNAKADTSSIPTKTSQLTNDSGFVVGGSGSTNFVFIDKTDGVSSNTKYFLLATLPSKASGGNIEGIEIEGLGWGGVGNVSKHYHITLNSRGGIAINQLGNATMNVAFYIQSNDAVNVYFKAENVTYERYVFLLKGTENTTVSKGRVYETSPTGTLTTSSVALYDNWYSINNQILNLTLTGWYWSTEYPHVEWKRPMASRTEYFIGGALIGPVFSIVAGSNKNLGTSPIVTSTSKWQMIPCMVGCTISGETKYLSGTVQIGGGLVNFYLNSGNIGTVYTVASIYLSTYRFFL